MSNLIGKNLLNRYSVTEFIGRGGMAEVYKVWDSERAVHLAVKVLHADLAQDKVFLRRFKREAENLARLQHPHIVRFYGLERDGLLVFMLMDFVAGESLKTRIFSKDAPFTPAEAKRIIKPVAAALHYAHNSGLVHCDIKPANIMLDPSGNVRLADFGIARMSDAATATMVGAGTPAYMAPEQIRGEDPTPQSDIYALGIVLYEMLTGGERPFTGEQAHITGSTSEKVRWEQRNTPPPSPKQWNPSILPKVEAVILKSLEKDVSQRYETALDFLNALELAIEPVEEPLPPPGRFDAQFEDIAGDNQQYDAEGKQGNGQTDVDVGEAESALSVADNLTNEHQAQSPRAIRQKRKWFSLAAVLLVLLALIGSVVFFIPDKSLPFSVIPSATKTRMPIPTKTRTPPTPTLAPPLLAQDYLTNIKVTDVDDFSSNVGWNMDAGKIAGGVLEVVGKDWNGLVRHGVFPEGTGILISFKAERGAEFTINYEYGKFNAPEYRCFGMNYWDMYPKTNLWFGSNMLETVNLTGNLSAKSETWYTLLLATDSEGELLAVVWETKESAKRAVYHETNEKWADYNWQLRIGANKGTILFDDLMEITFSRIK